MLVGLALAIVGAGMAPMDPAAQRSEPLFPRLTGGPRRMPPQRVARHQKARLEGAMVEAVAGANRVLTLDLHAGRSARVGGRGIGGGADQYLLDGRVGAGDDGCRGAVHRECADAA